MNEVSDRKVYAAPVLEILDVRETRASVSGSASVGVSVGVSLGS